MKNKTPADFVPDSRFATIGKEAKLVAVISVIHLAIFMMVATVYSKMDPTTYTYLFGFPAWFTICILVEIVTLAILAWVMLKKFSDIPLTADDPNYDYEQEEVER